MRAGDVLDFWFEEIKPAQWWHKDDAFDSLIRKRFAKVHVAANAGELYSWRDNALGRLAEIIVLDQFSRNMYRGNLKAFASDPLALVLAQEAVAGGFDEQLPETHRSFIYLPFMHSESPLIHQRAEELYRAKSGPSNIEFELRHKAIIDRFGRYPHRNKALDRKSTPEEVEFLNTPGSSF